MSEQTGWLYDWCGDPEPHPRHEWRGFAGGHNMDILTCRGIDTPPTQATR